jgi:hypothetical protein
MQNLLNRYLIIALYVEIEDGRQGIFDMKSYLEHGMQFLNNRW